MIFKRLKGKIKRNSSGQSFVELLLVTIIMALILGGVVEFGFLLNYYMHVLDGAREAARFASSLPAFETSATGGVAVDGSGNVINNTPFYYRAADKAGTTMVPVELDPVNGDDIVVSVFSVSGASITRFPESNGWSLCGHYAAFVHYFTVDLGAEVPEHLGAAGWSSGCTAHTSGFSSEDILDRMDEVAPPTGVLLVEIYYGFPQILKMPLLSGMEFFGTQFSIIPDPIPLYVYTVMPLSSAEPTPTP
jgi:hypothetical protein